MTSHHRSGEPVLDLRSVPAAARGQAVNRAVDQLGVGDSLLLLSDGDSRQLGSELEREYAEALTWEIAPDPDTVGIRVTKHASTALPRRVGSSVEDAAPATASAGSVWQLRPSRRSLDANVIALPPGDEIRDHVGPDLDVLIHVLSGTGVLTTETTRITLEPGGLVWLPRRSRRRFTAGPGGLRYFTVHQRKQGLGIAAAPPPHSL
ncbi:cupin domain [Brevibacterium sanguinis]|uniref:Cupin domain n=2 Tax=Brevibacterium TaxID=1696 RepID=A0A366II71_9MICO|nr:MULTISPECIES: cupin domain-containing protein [Brevibacterium]RBP64156.1 cupin domain [Brevibacterium sanguinis]RBP71552.1 cupin domain [Brevibacterium celere]